MKKTSNSIKLQRILDKWPYLADYPIRVKEADVAARRTLINLISFVKQDELIAKELEEKNQKKFEF